MDVIGTVAFAVSGAVLAIRKQMDLFGVNILAIVTATGGGLFRDLLIGKTVPVMFRNPMYVLFAAVTANLVFLFFLYQRKRHMVIPDRAVKIYEGSLLIFDTLGLAAFTVDGVYAGAQTPYGTNLFLIVFLGVITGVGGGMIRDVLAMEMPAVFVKHVYASASIVGALAMGILLKAGSGENTAIMTGFVLTMMIRFLAAKYRWNLPKIR